jgi:hypothetical protein
MTSIYDAVSSRALATITRKGAAVTFPGGGAPIYDPATDTFSGGGGTAVTGRAVQIDGDPDRFAALSLVLVNPVTLLVAAMGLAIVPAPGGTFVWAGKTYTIKDVEPVAPDGTSIIYTITGDA